MFVTFKYDNFPNIYVTLGKLNSTEEFNVLTDEWLRLYQKKEYFTFIFDTTNLEVYNIKYSFKMSAFIYRLKKEPEQYLKKSINLINNSFIQYLLDFIFYIQSPVAPVYIVKENDDIKKILDGEEIDCKIIYP